MGLCDKGLCHLREAGEAGANLLFLGHAQRQGTWQTIVLGLVKRGVSSTKSDGEDSFLLDTVRAAKEKGNHIIYICLGTEISHARKLYETVMDDLADLPDVQVVFALGVAAHLGRQFENMREWKRFWPPYRAVPSNFILVPYAPQVQILKLADIFVTHCGTGGISEALINAVPMVGIPCRGDQLFTARRLEKKGLLINLQQHTTCRKDRRNELSVAAGHIRRAVKGVLQNYGRYKEALQKQRALVDENAMGPLQVADLILRTAEFNFTSACMRMIKHPIPF